MRKVKEKKVYVTKENKIMNILKPKAYFQIQKAVRSIKVICKEFTVLQVSKKNIKEYKINAHFNIS